MAKRSAARKEAVDPASAPRRRRLKHGKRTSLSKGRKIALWICCITCALLIAGTVFLGGYAWNLWKLSQQSIQTPPTELTPEDQGIENPEDFPEGIYNIALFGIDSRSDKAEGAEYQQGLSDSIMILSVNADTGSVKLISVMRDSLVKVEGKGFQKINAAYSYGGPNLAVKTLNQTFKLNIMDYATVDFVGMAEIVDAVGGIEANVTRAEVGNANEQILEMASTRGTKLDYIKGAGLQKLNGIQAVAWARIRYVPTADGAHGDQGRTERQRHVMSQLFLQAKSMKLLQYPEMIRKILPFVQTSMSYDEIFTLAKVLTLDGVELQNNRVPTDYQGQIRNADGSLSAKKGSMVISYGFYAGYLGSCVYYDLDFAAELIRAFIFDNVPFEAYIDANGIARNDWYDGPRGNPYASTDSISSDTEETTDTGNVTDTQPGFESGSGNGGSGRPGTGSTDSSQTTDTGNASDTGNPTDTGTTDSSGTGDSGNPSDTESSASSESSSGAEERRRR